MGSTGCTSARVIFQIEGEIYRTKLTILSEDLVTFSSFTMLRDHYLCLVPTPKGNLIAVKAHTLHSCSPLPSHRRVLVDWPILGILYKWNHTIWDLLCQASVTWLNVGDVRPHYRM